MRRILGCLLSLAALISFGTEAQTPTISTRPRIGLADVVAAIDAQGAQWTAAENSITRESPSARISRLGWRLGATRAAQSLTPFAPGKRRLPSSFDWRDRAVVTPVKDQGQCGSCWAFASVAALESAAIIAGFRPSDDSEQFLVSYSSRNDGCDGGGLYDTADFLKSTGSISETCLPYRADDAKLPLPCSRLIRERIRVTKWWSVPQTVESLKAAVYQSPLPVGFDVYEDFLYYEAGIYSHETGTFAGGHAVLIVGWNDDDQYFIVKNSWAKDWGEDGFFLIAYSQVTNEVRFGLEAVLIQSIWLKR